MKVQALSGFFVECTILELDPMTSDQSKKNLKDPWWILHVDRASSSCGSGAELIVATLDGIVTKYALMFNFNASNNTTKYEALVVALKVAKDLQIQKLKVFSDS